MQSESLNFNWLRDKNFDLTFIFLFSVIAILASFYVSTHPESFDDIMKVNIWLLGFHHVIATYTRISFSKKSLKENKFLVFILPIITIFAVVYAANYYGGWIIASIYLYWQWFHYTRQSYGISRFYLGKAKLLTQPFKDINTYALYLLPLSGILYRSYQAPEIFLYLNLKVIPVSYEVFQTVFALAIGAILLQIINWIKQYRNGALSMPYVLYCISHHVIFGIGYIAFENINHGWLLLNIWHNAQYLGFVWMFNNNKYKTGIDEEEKFISRLSQTENIYKYFLTFLFITFIFYLLVNLASLALEVITSAPAILLAYMSINFHHYIVDSVIWKRKAVVKKNLAKI